MPRKDAFALLSVGIILFALGFFLTFFWMEGLAQRSYVVKAGRVLVLAWYLEEGERTEGSFTVTGGSEEARLSIFSPSGEKIYVWYARGLYSNGFTARETGTYTMMFENLDKTNDESIYVGFRSPYEPRLTIYNGIGLLTMLGSAVALFFGFRALNK
jgi:hypothetical protein